MKRSGDFPHEMLIIGLLSTDAAMRDDAKARLEELYGPSRYAAESLPFHYTSYYDEEMGGDIWRDFLFFDTLIDPSRIAEVKIATNELEERYRVDGGRRVNLDPGLLSLGKLILASTKDNAQRIPLSRGIYGEITLIYKKKRFQPLPWTYPDYRSEEYQNILRKMREELKKKLEI